MAKGKRQRAKDQEIEDRRKPKQIKTEKSGVRIKKAYHQFS
jgi:hypothetical protein